MTTSSRAVDVVAILDGESQKQVLESARPMRAAVYETADLMEHPLETGATIADHIVFAPVEIDLPLMINGPTVKDIFAELRGFYLAGSLLTVQTRARSYENMVLMEIPHGEEPEAITSLTVSVRLREANFVAPQYGGIAPKQVKEADKGKVSTTKRGAQQTTKTPPAKEAKAAAQAKDTIALGAAKRLGVL